MEENGNIERIDQEHIANNFLSKTDREPNFYIDVEGIVPFEQYIKEKNELDKNAQDEPREGEEQEEMESSGAFAIPLTFADGSTLDVIVSKEGVEHGAVHTDPEGKVTSIELSSKNQKAILRALNGIEGKVDAATILAAITPATLEEMQRSIVEDNLVPKDSEELAQKVNAKYPNLVKAPEGKDLSEKETTKEDIEEVQKKQEEAEESLNKAPEEIRDKIAELCSKNNLDINLLKEVMEVPPEAINENIENTGINNNGGNVYCLRFGNKGLDSNGKDRIVMIQGDQPPVDERQYDENMTDYMIEHRGETPETAKKHEHMITYTDIEGNTTVQEIHKEPRDLTYDQKEQMEKELEQLQEAANGVKNNPNISQEEKEELYMQINNKRIAVFEKYGIYPESVMEELNADQERLEEKTEPEDDEERPEPEIEDEENGEHGFPEYGERGGFPFGNHRLF